MVSVPEVIGVAVVPIEISFAALPPIVLFAIIQGEGPAVRIPLNTNPVDAEADLNVIAEMRLLTMLGVAKAVFEVASMPEANGVPLGAMIVMGLAEEPIMFPFPVPLAPIL